jgi:VCBS repeat-containing protein
MFINDVGENTWEEIDDGIAGSNYGWPTTEGPTSDPRFRSPIFWYGHGSSSTTGCAITGGAFYNPPSARFPASYVGDYFFADFCSGWIRKLDPAHGNSVADFTSGAAAPVDLLVGSDGLLYYLTRGGAAGTVYRVSFSAAPGVLGNDSDADGDAISAVLFTLPSHGLVTLNPDGSFLYVPDANFNGTDSFTYKANDGQADSAPATVTITVNPVNDPPAAVDDSYSTNEDTAPGIPPTGVLTNNTSTASGIRLPILAWPKRSSRRAWLRHSGASVRRSVRPEPCAPVARQSSPRAQPFQAVSSGSFSAQPCCVASDSAWLRHQRSVS